MRQDTNSGRLQIMRQQNLSFFFLFELHLETRTIAKTIFFEAINEMFNEFVAHLKNVQSIFLWHLRDLEAFIEWNDFFDAGHICERGGRFAIWRTFWTLSAAGRFGCYWYCVGFIRSMNNGGRWFVQHFQSLNATSWTTVKEKILFCPILLKWIKNEPIIIITWIFN